MQKVVIMTTQYETLIGEDKLEHPNLQETDHGRQLRNIEHFNPDDLRAIDANEVQRSEVVKPQFASHAELEATMQRKLETSTATYADRFSPERMRQWVQQKNLSFAEVAREAQHANMTPQETGTLVHRVAELRTLEHQQRRLLNGERFVEFSPGDSTKELDLVTVRGDKSYIHDYKPVNLVDVENKPWARDFKRWLDETHGGDYTKIRGLNTMPPDLHDQFRDFVAEAVAKHREQLRQYCDLYADATGVARNKVTPSVYPYYVWR